MPRTLEVEFPSGHILGQPHDREGQMRVIRQALDVLEKANAPGTLEEALRDSHPETPPITAEIERHIGKFLRGLRRGRR